MKNKQRVVVSKNKTDEDINNEISSSESSKEVIIINKEFKHIGVNEALKNLVIEGTTIVRTREDARRVI
jgi:hypothetical protein